MLRIDKNLTLKETPLGKPFDLRILEAVQKLFPNIQIDWVTYKQIKKDLSKATRTFHIENAYNWRDK